jgi:hypothetical protein
MVGFQGISPIVELGSAARGKLDARQDRQLHGVQIEGVFPEEGRVAHADDGIRPFDRGRIHAVVLDETESVYHFEGQRQAEREMVGDPVGAADGEFGQPVHTMNVVAVRGLGQQAVIGEGFRFLIAEARFYGGIFFVQGAGTDGAAAHGALAVVRPGGGGG